MNEEPKDPDAKALFRDNSEQLRIIDEDTHSEVDLWDHYRGIYHKRELIDPSNEVIGQIYIEKTNNDTIIFKYLFGSRHYPFSPTIFKKWVEEEGFRISESQTL